MFGHSEKKVMNSGNLKDWRIAGAVFVVAALGWFLLEAIAASQFPGYSYASNYISDLGVPDPGVFQGRSLNSPLSSVANFMFITQGLLFLAAATIVVRTATAGVGRWLFLLFSVGYAIGFILIGAFHGSAQATTNGTFMLHVLGGSLGCVFGNLAIIAAGLSAHKLGAPVAYRNFSLGISFVSIASLAILVGTSSGATIVQVSSGPLDGIWERGGCYAIIIWELVTGVVLLAAANKSH
jgi:hypothetical membrane protein